MLARVLLVATVLSLTLGTASAYTFSLVNGNVVVTVDPYAPPAPATGTGVNGSVELKPLGLRVEYVAACVDRLDGLEGCVVALTHADATSPTTVAAIVLAGCTHAGTDPYCTVLPAVVYDQGPPGNDAIVATYPLVFTSPEPDALHVCNVLIVGGAPPVREAECVRAGLDQATLCGYAEVTRGTYFTPPFTLGSTATACTAAGSVCQQSFGSDVPARTCLRVGLAEGPTGTCVRVTVEDATTSTPFDVFCFQGRARAHPPGTLP